VGAAAALLLGCTISYFGYWRAWSSVRTDASYFGPAITKVDNTVKQVGDYKTAYEGAESKYKKTAAVSSSLTIPDDRRTRWLQLLAAINAALPRDPAGVAPPEKLADRNLINILSIQSQRVDDLGAAYGEIREQFDKPDAPPPVAAAAPAGDAASTEDGAAPPAADAAAAPAPAEIPPPTGPGWVVELRGYHFHNTPGKLDTGDKYVRDTLIKNLKAGTITLPAVDGGKPTSIDLKKLGVSHPVLLPPLGKNEFSIDRNFKLEKPQDPDKAPPVAVGNNAAGGAFAAGGAAPVAKGEPETEIASRFDFLVQLYWADEPPKETADAATTDTATAEPGKGDAGEPGAATPTPAQPDATPAEPADEKPATEETPAEPAAADKPATEGEPAGESGKAPGDAPAPDAPPAEGEPKPPVPGEAPAEPAPVPPA
jgi:type IV pilus assembly protein PilM